MPTVCIQCSMRALLDDKPPPVFDETIEEHMAAHHPDPVETQRERAQLEYQLSKKLKKE